MADFTLALDWYHGLTVAYYSLTPLNKFRTQFGLCKVLNININYIITFFISYKSFNYFQPKFCKSYPTQHYNNPSACMWSKEQKIMDIQLWFPRSSFLRLLSTWSCQFRLYPNWPRKNLAVYTRLKGIWSVMKLKVLRLE